MTTDHNHNYLDDFEDQPDTHHNDSDAVLQHSISTIKTSTQPSANHTLSNPHNSINLTTHSYNSYVQQQQQQHADPSSALTSRALQLQQMLDNLSKSTASLGPIAVGGVQSVNVSGNTTDSILKNTGALLATSSHAPTIDQHHYRLTINLQSLQVQRSHFTAHSYTSSIAHLYIQYHHSLLNDSQPQTTWPPQGIDTFSLSAQPLDDDCNTQKTFDLYTTTTQLIHQLSGESLSVQVLMRDAVQEQDVEVLSGALNLVDLIHCTPSTSNDGNVLSSRRRTVDVELKSTEKAEKSTGKLHVELQLDDLSTSATAGQSSIIKPTQQYDVSSPLKPQQHYQPEPHQQQASKAAYIEQTPYKSQYQVQALQASPLPADNTYSSVIDSTLAANHPKYFSTDSQRPSIIGGLTNRTEQPNTARHNPQSTPAHNHSALYDTDLAAQRATAEYQIAWELEQWRKQQQAQYEAEWKLQEQQRMQTLEQEFRRQEALRQQQHREKLKATQNIETKLQQAMSEIKTQELQLKLESEELAKRRSYIDKEITHGKEDALILVRRMKDQLQHQQHLNTQHTAEHDQQMKEMKAKMAQSEQRAKAAEEALRKLKIEHAKSTSGELRLQLQQRDDTIKQLQQQSTAQQQKHDTLAKRLVRALQEIDKLKKDLSNNERERLLAERDEYARLKVQQMVGSSAGRDATELREIRKELERLKAMPTSF